jgi:exonuclease V
MLKPIPQTETVPNPRNKRTSTSAPGTPRKSKKQRELSPTQSVLTDFLAATPKAKARKSASPPRPMVHELSLIDTKTRRTNSLPSDDDALSSRMQLMLYHHLLSALLSPTFSFSAFWEKVHVDPLAPLSDAFLLQSGLARKTEGEVVLGCAECLDDLAELWHMTVHKLQVQGVSPTLEIVYRTQRKRRDAAPEVSRQGTLDEHFGAADREARDVMRAIEASRRENEYDSDLQRAIAESLRDVTPKEDKEDCEAELAGGNSVADTRSPLPPVPEKLSDLCTRWYGRDAATESTRSEGVEKERPTGESGLAELGTGTSKPEEPQPKTANIIGRKSFAFDEGIMHAYVQDVLQWWSGERPPRGVDIEHSNRCL